MVAIRKKISIMKKTILLLLVLSALFGNAQMINVSSPDRNIELSIYLTGTGELNYLVNYKKKNIVLPSSLSIKFREPDVNLFQFTLEDSMITTHDETWKPAWGEYSSIRDNHTEATLVLKDKNGSGIEILVA